VNFIFLFTVGIL